MEFEINNILPLNLQIPEAGSHLYRIGLSLFPYGNKSRYRFCNPLLIWIMIFIQLSKSCISLLINSNDPKSYLLIGDSPYFLNLKIHINLGMIVAIQLEIKSLLSHMYYYYYSNGEKPCYMKPFDMMSGLVSPQSIGLTNCGHIRILLNKSRNLFRIYYKISRFVYPFFILVFLSLATNCSSITEIIFIAIPSALLFSLNYFHYMNIYLCQLIYFDIICLYLRLKLNSINYDLKINKYNKSRIFNVLTSIYNEINQINNDYWSSFLLWLIFINLIIIDIMIYLIIFSNNYFYFNITMTYNVISVTIILLYFLNTASLVYSEAFNSYKHLNSVLVSKDKGYNIKFSLKVLSLKSFY
jgi:hypothetical protein